MLSAPLFTSPVHISLGSFFCESGNPPSGSGEEEEEDACVEGFWGAVPVERDVPLPPASIGPRLLTVCPSVQPQLCQEETVSGTGEGTNVGLLSWNSETNGIS